MFGLRKKEGEGEIERDEMGLPRYGVKSSPSYRERGRQVVSALRGGLESASGLMKRVNSAATPERTMKVQRRARQVKHAADSILFGDWGMGGFGLSPPREGGKRNSRTVVHIHIHDGRGRKRKMKRKRRIAKL